MLLSTPYLILTPTFTRLLIVPPYLLPLSIFFGQLECVCVCILSRGALLRRLRLMHRRRAGLGCAYDFYVVVKYAGFYFSFSAAVAGFERLVSTAFNRGQFAAHRPLV
jgi:hypothetical protein